MEPRLQRRVQRYGWDLAAAAYEPLWQSQLAPAHYALLNATALAPGERVLDVACGTGLVTLRAARGVFPGGQAVGTDLSGRMVEAAERAAARHGVGNARFVRMDAERLDLSAASFDATLCALGLMYLPHPERAMREMRRVLRAGGRAVVAVWGLRSRCGWAPVFPIVDAEVESDVCPLFFSLGTEGALSRLCLDAGFAPVDEQRIAATLSYADADDACNAAFAAGPAALAWSRFADPVRKRVRARYLDAIEPWKRGRGYALPGEFVVAAAKAPDQGVGEGEDSRAARIASLNDHTADA